MWRLDIHQATHFHVNRSYAAVYWTLKGMVIHHLTLAHIVQVEGVFLKSHQHHRPSGQDCTY